MNNIVNITKALADDNRVRALMILAGHELCLCQIIELLNLAPSTVSRHMSILRRAGLVESRKENRWVYYSLPKGNIPSYVTDVLEWLRTALDKDVQIKKDRKRLKEIMKVDLEIICRRQMKS
ncbi:MAG: winged helix-turn-helix transcriptional regulator [Candidatus Zixiibacteriota bacterium]|nr:MAG: winged helix-turn-helix transcriptional regulator [candidate division Zixibacteria bacterium]